MYNTCGNVRIFQDLSYFAESFTVNQKLQTEIVQLREQLAEAQEEVACLQIRENQLEQEKKEILKEAQEKFAHLQIRVNQLEQQKKEICSGR